MPDFDLKPLRPKTPPGRASRKALGYTSEIQRLRALGYSFEAIRIALLDVGVQIGLTALRREAARSRDRAPLLQEAQTSLATTRLEHGSPSAPALPRAAGAAVQVRSGKDIAESFVQSHVSHPLV